MDHTPVKETDIVIDIESCVNSGKDVANLDLSNDQVKNEVSFTVCGTPMAVGELGNCETEVSLPSSMKHVSEAVSDSGKNVKKDGRKSTCAKKPPKPPRPPKGLSLDAADQRLIREISDDLAMIKRAKIERLKALKRMKAGKASPSSSSGSFIALLLTLLFCALIVFQGCHSSGTQAKIRIRGSSESSETTYGSIIVVQRQHNSSTTSAGSPSLIESTPGSDIKTDGEASLH